MSPRRCEVSLRDEGEDVKRFSVTTRSKSKLDHARFKPSRLSKPPRTTAELLHPELSPAAGALVSLDRAQFPSLTVLMENSYKWEAA